MAFKDKWRSRGLDYIQKKIKIQKVQIKVNDHLFGADFDFKIYILNLIPFSNLNCVLCCGEWVFLYFCILGQWWKIYRVFDSWWINSSTWSIRIWWYWWGKLCNILDLFTLCLVCSAILFILLLESCFNIYYTRKILE